MLLTEIPHNWVKVSSRAPLGGLEVLHKSLLRERTNQLFCRDVLYIILYTVLYSIYCTIYCTVYCAVYCTI